MGYTGMRKLHICSCCCCHTILLHVYLWRPFRTTRSFLSHLFSTKRNFAVMMMAFCAQFSFFPPCHKLHGVWKSQKKYHSTLRAKRATFTFWVDESWLKMPKMVYFGEFLKTWSLRSNSVTRQVTFNRTKIGGKCQNCKIQMRHLGWFFKYFSWILGG